VSKLILSNVFGQALADAGIVEDIDTVQRVVIDVQAGEPLMIYVQRFGDERWLDVAPLAAGAEVITK
jgi:hypothetical protein